MPRHFYFRDNGDGIFSLRRQSPLLFLPGIETTMPGIVISFTWVVANDGAVAPGAHFCKPGIFFYLDPPALVLC